MRRGSLQSTCRHTTLVGRSKSPGARLETNVKTATLTLLALLLTANASAFELERNLGQIAVGEAPESVELVVTQGRCMNLSQAVESVRKRSNVERIVSANTRNGVHHIRYMTKDGKVRTEKIPDCRR